MLATVFALGYAPPNADPLAGLNFRPPAIPLITTDPFMQVWIRGNSSTAPNVTHWTGQPKTTTGLLRVDGTTYRYLGNGTEPPLKRSPVGRPCSTLGRSSARITGERWVVGGSRSAG